MTTEPLVSILINNFNYAKFLSDAIESALHQTYPNIEVIVVDDGSTDESHQIIERYGDRIKPVLKPNGGQASAFNAGFAASHGEIICFLDSDDLFLSDKIEKIVEIFDRYPQAAWCFHPLKLLDFTTQETFTAAYSGTSGIYDLTEPVQQGKLAGRMPFEGTATSGLCYRRSLLERILPMPETIRITSDDYIKYIALGTYSGYIPLQELSIQRIHGNNAYTLRPEKLFLRAKILMLTAYWMRLNHPVLGKFSNNLFALGISYSWRAQTNDQEIKDLTQKYFDSTPLIEKLKIILRALYYRIKT